MAKIVPNKVIAFNVPQTEHEVVRVQVDDVSHFYDKIHQHPEIQIMFIQSGEGTLIAGDYVGRFQAGDVLVMGSDQPHVFRCDPGFYKEDSILCARSISLYFSEKYFGKELWDSNEMAAGIRVAFMFAASSGSQNWKRSSRRSRRRPEITSQAS